ncbi:hypothetical protein F5B22DRAFT_659692 [Xylaria bambusicola]|uniref:uncharacterized protein n=1 Tax=Xylaria bambusicola TaxID=326684 RepID=UPI0020083CEA|nr:uncharacterized protein F5B22DRAFT_659692 [Xylaria bambusicola]KAI0523923.1 hypothetical protein F5B22DRAFT_659692 [Xylaria bambusicola]
MHSPTDSCILPQESLATSQHDETARVQPEPLSLRPSVEKRQRKLRDICEYVANILRDLCQKDSRFLYLQEAIAEFLDGDLGLRELGCRTQHVASTLSLQGEDGLITQDIKSEPILRSHIIPDVDMGDYLFLAAPFEILSSVIYEILDVFNIDITVQEATVPHKTLAYLDLLHRLYDRTRNREPKPRKLRIHSFEFNSHFNSNFVYQSKLDLTTDQVRVVKLSPGKASNLRYFLQILEGPQ